jgi:aarF domain-containing kinase
MYLTHPLFLQFFILQIHIQVSIDKKYESADKINRQYLTSHAWHYFFPICTGNLLVTPEGKLCLLDFGLCAEVDPKSRRAMTKAIVHLLHRDFDALVSEDAIELGFLPADFDTGSLTPLLAKVLTVAIVEPGSNLRKRKKKLMEISNELNEIFFRFPFSVPPYFALVTRGLGLLEGIALTGDPDFDIFEASVPYATRRAISMIGSHRLRSWTFRRRRYTQALP